MIPEKLFITGGSGYLGRNLIRHYVALGVPVIALARSAMAAETVSQLGAEPWRGDLSAPELWRGMTGCDSLIHAAADTDHGRGSAAQIATNLAGTGHVLDAAEQAGIARVVHISTESVLLDGGPLVNVDETHPIPPRPVGNYSASKAAAEQLALSRSQDGLAVMAVRPRLVWGRDDTTALPQLIAAARSGQLAWIDGGHYATSSTHIANLCLGVHLALARGQGGQAYFITDGPAWEFRALISAMLRANGIEPPDKTVPRWLLRTMATVGDVLAKLTDGRVTLPITMQSFATSAVEITLNITKAQTELGYRPVIGIEQGLADMRANAALGDQIGVVPKA